MENIVVPRALLTSRTPEEAGLDDGSAVDEIYNLYSGHERGVSIYNERSERRNTYQQFLRQSRMPIVPALNPDDTSPDLGWRHSAGPFSPYSDPETPGLQEEHVPERQEEIGEERQETLSISSFETSSSEDLSTYSEPEVIGERHSHTASRDLLSNTPFKLQPAPKRKSLRPTPIQILNVPVGPRIVDLAAEEQREITITEEPSLNRGVSVKNKRKTVLHRASVFINGHGRKTSLAELYTTAKTRQKVMNRSKLVQRCFELAVYGLIIAVIYFVFVGMPLWKGCVFWLYWITAHKFVVPGGFTIVLGIAFLYAFLPLVILFEPDPPAQTVVSEKEPPVTSVALLIPCYKSAKILPATLKAALLVFPAESIFVLSNGNSATPLDDTAEVCAEYGVNHTWTPIGSKIIAQFIGCYVSKAYPHVLLIDDDCLLPPNFPLSPVEKLKDKVNVIGYTIKSVGANGSRGTLAQRAQDLEYKLSGLQRAFAGKVGSATFPHGAISLWDREFLLETFKSHPGFSVSEDWFFGHVARTLGSRIVMSTSVFVETETPASIFWNSGGGDRGGFGEMTIYQQRFKRWNFFFVNGMYWNMRYILCSWKLGWWEIGSKIFVFQEVYETLLYLATPFVLPISFIVRPLFCTYLLIATFGMYLLNTVIFNEVHLRRKNQRVDTLAIIYYMPYKMILTFINVASCYWSILKYASYFARRHPKVVEDEKVIEVALRIEEEALYDWDEFRETLHTPAPSLRSPSIRGTPAQSLRSFI